MVIQSTFLPLGIVKGLGALEGTLTTYGTYFYPFLWGGGKKKKKRSHRRKRRSKGKRTSHCKCDVCKCNPCKCNKKHNKHTKRKNKTRNRS